MISPKKSGILLPLEKEENFDNVNADSNQKNQLTFLLKLTGLYFGELKDGTFWYYFGILRALIVSILSVYQTCFEAYHIVTRIHDHKTPILIFLLSCHVQAFLSIIFLVYWQFKGHLAVLCSILKWPGTKDKRYYETRASIKTVLAILTLQISYFIFKFSFYFYSKITNNMKWFLLDSDDVKRVYPFKYGPIIRFFVSFINVYTCLIILAFYIIVCYILHGDFVVFNRKLQEVGSDTKHDTLGNQILNMYTEHIKMAKVVRMVDSTFEVYTFFMIGLNIPTMIFSLISCFTATSKEHLIMLIMGPFFCILQLFGLISIPARVHTTIQEVKNILYNNTNIWTPFNEKVYQIASVFVSHVDQANLGISVWGFAVVTKPLILTTVSLTITYLTILLQLQINQKVTYQKIPYNMSKIDF